MALNLGFSDFETAKDELPQGFNTAAKIELILAGAIKVHDVVDSTPWLQVCQVVADDQGFFHWELDFASVFGRGGFDLQVGNPPWVRPDWDEKAVFAEHDPWWQLAAKPSQTETVKHRDSAFTDLNQIEFMCGQAAGIVAVREFLSSEATYPIVAGLRPDLYRSFMERTWWSSKSSGVVGLLHPESHFTEKKAAHLRAETYRRLRRHWQFINELSLFEIHHLVSYGVHVYGARRESPAFVMAASLYHPDTVARSIAHDGSGEVPGLKDPNGNWDQRPHNERIIHVDSTVLAVWADILDEPGTAAVHARMVYPVNRASSKVLTGLSRAPRLGNCGYEYSRGWDEGADRRKGRFEVGSHVPECWNDVILMGPHFIIGTPFAKQPNPSMKNNLDWMELDLESLPMEFIPRTSYQPSGSPEMYRADYSWWGTSRQVSAQDVYRVAWRRMSGIGGVRSLQPAIVPPGVAHVDNVNTLGFTDKSDDKLSLLLAIGGFLSALLPDFIMKVSGASKINPDSLAKLPFFGDFPLMNELVYRAARLNCLTAAYEPLWTSTIGTPWLSESPARNARDRRKLLIEIDALAALMLGVSSDALCTIYRTQFPVLQGYERSDLYDKNGRKVPGEMNKAFKHHGEALSEEQRTWVHPQSSVTYVFEFPFVGYDREADMRAAHAHFTKLMEEMD